MTNIPPETYRVQVTRTGYVQATRSSQVALEPNQTRKGVQLELTPGGVITGRVVNEDGTPQANISVTAARVQYEDGTPTVSFCVAPVGLQAATDSEGRYRLYGLDPGRYYVVLHTLTCNTVPQFYPGVTDPRDAIPIEVSAGSEYVLDTRIHEFEGYSVRFKAVDPPSFRYAGFLGSANVVMRGADDVRFRLMDLNSYASHFSKGPDGQYTIAELPPGDYTIYYGSDMIFANIARFDVHLVDRDVDAGTVFASDLVEGLSGRVISNLPLTSVGRLRVRLHAADGPFPSSHFRSNLSAAVNAPEGTFRFGPIAGQLYFIDVLGLPPNAYLASARYGPRDVLREGLLLDGQPSGSLELEVKEAGGGVEGVVRDVKMDLLQYGLVTLIPSATASKNPLFFRTSSIAGNGTYSMIGVLPGDYLLLAWESVEPGAWANDRFLESFRSQARKITIREGIQSQIDLQEIPADKR